MARASLDERHQFDPSAGDGSSGGGSIGRNSSYSDATYPPTPDGSQMSLSVGQLTITTILSQPMEDVILKVESLPSASMCSASSGGHITDLVIPAATATDPTSLLKREKWYSVTLQIFIPFMIAGMGTIGAGLVLGSVEQYDVFKEVKSLYILVPSILGLKGNLDMCLASRLSTQANLGHMKTKQEVFKMILGNIALVQVQAIVAALLVSIFAVCVSALMNGNFEPSDALLVSTSSVITATLSCFILDFVLVAVISFTQSVSMNPDNLATPLAASVGDVVSLLLLSTVASFLFELIDDYWYVLLLVLGFYTIVILPCWILIVRRNSYTKDILATGWTPVLSALLLSGMGGLVLDQAVDDFPGFVLFQPIINGIGGNLVSVQSSRISTMLHQTSLPGIFPPHTKQWVAPWTALFRGVFSAKVGRILILMSIPGQTVFMFVADLIYNEGTSTITAPFALTYLFVTLMQIMLLLYVAHLLIHAMWHWKVDPDNSAIPYLTALGDLLGSCFLLLAFMFLRSIGYEYTPSA